MSNFPPKSPDGEKLEDGIGAPPENAHLVAHHAAMRTHEMAVSLADRVANLHKEATDLVASTEDAKARSAHAHAHLLPQAEPAVHEVLEPTAFELPSDVEPPLEPDPKPHTKSHSHKK